MNMVQVNIHNPKRGCQIIGNYGREAKRVTVNQPWTFGPWTRWFSLKYATIVQSHRLRHSRSYRRRVFGDRARF